MTDSRFLSRCVDITEIIVDVGDEVGASEDATFDSIEELHELSDSSIDDEFVFGLRCVRNGWIYRVLGTPNHDYIEFIFEHDLYDAIVMNTVFTQEEQNELSIEEQSSRLNAAQVSFEEADSLLGEIRQIEQEQITSRLHTELANQTACNFDINHTDTGDVFRVEAHKKVFLDDVSHGEVEDAVVSITNTGKKIVALLSDSYAAESVTPQMLAELRR